MTAPCHRNATAPRFMVPVTPLNADGDSAERVMVCQEVRNGYMPLDLRQITGRELEYGGTRYRVVDKHPVGWGPGQAGRRADGSVIAAPGAPGYWSLEVVRPARKRQLRLRAREVQILRTIASAQDGPPAAEFVQMIGNVSTADFRRLAQFGLVRGDDHWKPGDHPQWIAITEHGRAALAAADPQPAPAPEPDVVTRAIQLLTDRLGLTPPGAGGTPAVRLELTSWARSGRSGEVGAVVQIAGAPAPETTAHRDLQGLLIARALLPVMPTEAVALEALAHAVLRQYRA